MQDRAFVGREALLQPATRQLRPMRLLELLDGSLDPYYGHPVLAGDRVVGLVTSGSYGFRTDQRLALAYLDRTAAGNEPLQVQILDERCRARILEAAPYDPGNQRLRA